MSNPWYSQMSPESYTRYSLLARILGSSLGKTQSKILELGGKGSYIWEIFRDANLPYSLTIADVLPPGPPSPDFTYIQADAAKTGLSDESFAAVISTDTLEHVPLDHRAAFIAEAVRLAKDIVIIACPCESPGVAEAESRANEFYRELTGASHPWLQEHADTGRPTRESIEQIIADLNLPYLHFGSNRLDAWLASLLINMLPEKIAIDSSKVARINEIYNDNFLSIGDFNEPTYRQFYVIYKSMPPPPSLDHYLSTDSDKKLFRQYIRSISTLLQDEVGVRYSRIVESGTTNSLSREIDHLECAASLVSNKPKYAVNKYIVMAKKAIIHPKKALQYLVYHVKGKHN